MGVIVGIKLRVGVIVGLIVGITIGAIVLTALGVNVGGTSDEDCVVTVAVGALSVGVVELSTLAMPKSIVGARVGSAFVPLFGVQPTISNVNMPKIIFFVSCELMVMNFP